MWAGCRHLLQRLIEKHVNMRRPFLPILLDADEIVADRGSSPDNSSDSRQPGVACTPYCKP